MADAEEYETTSVVDELSSVEESEDEEIEIPDEDIDIGSKKIVIVPNNKRKTSNLITEFEKARLINLMAQLSENEGLDFLKDEERKKFDNSIDIAKYQLFVLKKCPFKIRRLVNETSDTIYYEEWNPSTDEMIY